MMSFIFDGVFARIENRRLQQSRTSPVVAGYSRDSWRYYDKGRSVIVWGEMMSGSSGVDFVIYKSSPMAWDDSGAQLTPDEREMALNSVTKHLDDRKVRWQYR
jgi:hypothetical protein